MKPSSTRIVRSGSRRSLSSGTTVACVIATRPVRRGGNAKPVSDKGQHFFSQATELAVLVVARGSEGDCLRAALMQRANVVDALLRPAERRPVPHHALVEDGS